MAKAIGSVNFAEFFLTVAVSAALLSVLAVVEAAGTVTHLLHAEGAVAVGIQLAAVGADPRTARTRPPRASRASCGPRSRGC